MIMVTSPARQRRSISKIFVTMAAAALFATVAPATSSAADEGLGAVAGASVQKLTITPNPAYRSEEPFQGWGTSLVWFANATGEYPDAVRDELYDKVFGADGLNLNIARYNVGGGSATDVDESYFRQGGAVPGWWNGDLDGDGDTDEAVRDNAEAYRAAWSGDDDASYDFDADHGQRWWVERLAAEEKITHWEAFSNSPPWFMTPNGYVTGGFSSTTDQLLPESVDDFAAYMVRVVEYLEDTYGIDFATIDPMNEPNTDYWGTWLNADGSLQCCRQEGAHMGPALQAEIIEAVAERLEQPGTTTNAVTSGPDETNPGTFVTDWNGWTQAACDVVGQLNVHTYGTGDRVRARDIAKTADKPLWMSEVEGDFSGVDGFDPTNMDNGLGMASRIVDDLRELEPTAWVFWQPVEDLWNMEVTETANWGSVFIDFDCDADGNSARRLEAGYDDPSCQVVTNAKYNTVRNFTHHIAPGDYLIPTDNTQTTAFIGADGTTATLVHVNTTDDARAITLDLSGFGSWDGATVTPVVTTAPTDADLEANALVEGKPVPVAADGTATLTVPAESVTTFLVEGVSGVAAGTAPADDTDYLIQGMGSGLFLTGSTSGLTIEDLGSETAVTDAQSWTVHTLSGQGTNRRVVALSDATGQFLSTTGEHTIGVVLADLDEAATTPNLQWILNTTDGRTWSLLSVASTEQLDVNNEDTEAGTSVGTWYSSTGTHQRWTFQSTALQSVGEIHLQTATGVEPELPATVDPAYAWGAGTPVPVTWESPDASVWTEPGTVTVPGHGVDAFGTPFTATLLVDVGDFTVTDPVTVHVPVGASLADIQSLAANEVAAHIGVSPRSFPVPVTWDWIGVGDLTATTGYTEIPGTATTRSGEIPARLFVVVSEPSPTNVATLPTTSGSATYTEPGYSIAATMNGRTDDKAWSNWRGDGRNPSDTLTYDLGEVRDLDAARVYFYIDGSWNSWASQVRAEYRVDGVWTTGPTVAVPDPVDGPPVAEIDLAGVRADAVRFVLTPRTENGELLFLVVAEVEIDAAGPSPSNVADIATIRVGGVDVAGLSAKRPVYQVRIPAEQDLDITAHAVDSDAVVAITQPTVMGANQRVSVRVSAPDAMRFRSYTVVIVSP
ncbi:MAG: RICIN domain-containing protein [Propionibacteriaceae bacterium]|jgi:O-glycosyl hydrolase|nr:RICIN domain-containing protein [Propionibacteriaceae bacterium]